MRRLYLSGVAIFLKPRIFSTLAFCISALALGILAFVANAAPAVTITVNSLANTVSAGDSSCTLREAINNFNAQSDTTGGDCASGVGATLIQFSVSGTISLSPQIINNAAGLTIDGASNIVLDGGGTSRLVSVTSGDTVTVQNLTFQNAVAPPAGGAISNAGTLNVMSCTFTGNSSLGGGAISNTATLNVSRSYFASNSATDINRGGGAIANTTAGIANISNSTFYSNSSVNVAGAIQNNTTVTVTSCTFSKNSATNGGSSISNSGTANIVNTIFANSAAGTNCANFSGAFNADASDLSDDATCGNATQATSAQINLDSAPGPNGGPTLTIKLLPGSVAIDAVNPEFDQRGPNFFRIVNGRQDVGAFEVQTPTPTPTPTPSPTPTPCDENPPNINVPSDITAEAQKKKVNGQKGAFVSFSVSAFDPEDGPVTATADPPSGTFFPVGITTVVVTANDHCANCATKTFTVTVLK